MVKYGVPRLLGEILLRAKAITPRQLEDAISNQVVYGGRLGTNLMDLGYVSETVLANALSEQSGVSTIAPQAYTKIHVSIAKTLPKAVAERVLAVPVVLKDRVLHVVMADPHNIAAQDEIRFATGCRLQVYVAPEVRIWYLLNKLYGTKRDLRYVQISRSEQMTLRTTAMNPRRPANEPAAATAISWAGVQADSAVGDLMSEEDFARLTQGIGMGSGTTASAAHPTAEEEIILLGDVVDDDAEIIIVDESEAPAMATPTLAVGSSASEKPPVATLDTPPPPRQLTLTQATKALQHVQDRDQIARVVLGFASATFKRAALFVVRPGMVMGWDGIGEGLSRENIERLMIPLSAPSVFKLVCESRAHFLGALPKTPVNTRFLKTLGGEEPRSAFVIPIVFKSRVVNLLYGDNGPGSQATFDIGELLILAMKVPHSFENLLLRKRAAADTNGSEQRG